MYVLTYQSQFDNEVKCLGVYSTLEEAEKIGKMLQPL